MLRPMTTDDTTTTTGGPMLTLGEAVRTTGVSRSTLQRRLKAGTVPGAIRADDGTYQIPISGLIAAGMAPRVTPADTPAPVLDTELAARVAAAEARAERAEAEAAGLKRELERADANLADMRRAMAMLDAGPRGPQGAEGEPVGESATSAPAPVVVPTVRRWLMRRR